MTMRTIFAAMAFAAATSAHAASVPYVPYPSGTLSYGFTWSGLGDIDAIDGVPGDTVWTVDAPAGASYRAVGGYIASSALSDWIVLLDGVPLTRSDDTSSGDQGTVYRYFYAGPVTLQAGINTFSIQITEDGSGGAGGFGKMYFANDDTPLPTPLPAGIVLLASAIATALSVRRFG